MTSLNCLMNPIVSYKKYNSIYELKTSIEVPSIQRNVMEKQLLNMREYIRQCSKNLTEPVFGTIDLVAVSGMPRMFVCDGQHRLIAIEQEYTENGIIVPIHCLIYSVENYNQVVEIFRLRNLGVPVPEYYLTLEEAIDNRKELLRSIETYLESVPAFKHTSTNRPYINISSFIQALIKSKIYTLIKSIEDFGKILVLLNNECFTIVHEMDDKMRKKNGITQNMVNIWTNSGTWIGYNLNFPYFSSTEDILRFEILLSK